VLLYPTALSVITVLGGAHYVVCLQVTVYCWMRQFQVRFTKIGLEKQTLITSGLSVCQSAFYQSICVCLPVVCIHWTG